MATLNIRIDENVKSEAQAVLDELGLSMSNAVSIYFKQIARNRAIPFRLALDFGTFEPTEELARVVGEVKEDIRTGRNLSKPMGRADTLHHLQSLRK
jgi:DNA-damage-inducible protein J